MKFKVGQQLMDMALNNIYDYESFEDYGNQWEDPLTKEEFEMLLADNDIEDITIYVGIAGDTWPVEMNSNNKIDALIQYIHDTDFGNNYVEILGYDENTTDLEMALDLTDLKEVFTIDDKIYLKDY